VEEACKILAVSEMHVIATTKITHSHDSGLKPNSTNLLCQKSDQHYGELCLLSGSFKLLGKANTTIRVLQHTELQLVMDSLS
jgi:hypothetical protein